MTPRGRQGGKKDKTQGLLQRALGLRDSGDFDGCDKILAKLLKKTPTDTYLLCERAYGFTLQQHDSDAVRFYQKALKLDPSLEQAQLALAILLADQGRLLEARKLLERYVATESGNALAWTQLGATWLQGGTAGKAEELLQRALALDPDFPDARFMLSFALLEQGRLREGFECYRAGYAAGKRGYPKYPQRNDSGEVEKQRQPLWDGTAGQRVVVLGEMGLGDEVLFASVFADMAAVCPDMVIECSPRLEALFQRSFPDYRIYGTRACDDKPWAVDYQIDAVCPLSELGFHFRPTMESFPAHDAYLVADAGKREFWSERLRSLGNRPKIGIAWSGGTNQTGMKQRTLALAELQPLFDVIDADYISLQYQQSAEEDIAAFREASGVEIHHWGEACAMEGAVNDYDETAALVSNLDVVVTVPTSIYHLSAALDIPTYMLLPQGNVWPECNAGDSIYPHPNQTRVFKLNGENRRVAVTQLVQALKA